MDIKEFGINMTRKLESILGEGFETEFKEVIKNNGVKYHAVLIREKNQNVAPTIYLEHFFDEYQKGKDEDMIAKEILALYKHSMPSDLLDVQFFTDFSKACRNFCFKAVNYEKNKKKLGNIPYKRFEDLAFIPFCCVSSSRFGEGSITILNKHLRFWEVSFDELWENVFENAASTLPPYCENLMDFVNAHEELPFPPMNCNMYVVSNNIKTNGASAIFYPGMLEKMEEEIGGDFVIIPSSIHETIVLPRIDEDDELSVLKMMVKQVNTEVVSTEEILSDSVYVYDSETKRLTALE
nr:DUF5688 family protein [uncultured Butyrivibrio sp.]